LSSELFGSQLNVIEDVPAAIRARLTKRWTQAQLARWVGMEQPNIARLEGGNYDRLFLARALGAEIEIKLSA